jgi:hypothetical protein
MNQQKPVIVESLHADPVEFYRHNNLEGAPPRREVDRAVK